MEHTICYMTGRDHPKVEWLFDSLKYQLLPGDDITVVIVDLQREKRTITSNDFMVRHIPPKPNVWQGASRLTNENWWALSNARNTGICCCQTEWLSFLDDRCILSPHWLQCVREAQRAGYGMLGKYQKQKGIAADRPGELYEYGMIQWGEITGEDGRAEYVKKNWDNIAPVKCPGEWSFGCNITLPVEWCLVVNGFDEICDGLSMEDVIFGKMLENNGYPMCYDHRALMTEDRTPGECEPVMIRKDKGISPNDKSHALLSMLKDLKRAKHPIDLRHIRADFLEGKGFPAPWGPIADWYDGQLLSDM